MTPNAAEQEPIPRKVQAMNIKPIPAFYCCYLLRSTTQHTAAYIGSTPHPIRRLAQHNGLIKGGAWKTAGDSKRPWEMTCLVAGFPSHIAALQFEWAWQNPYLSRHNAGYGTSTSRKSSIRSNSQGQGRPKRSRPRASLSNSIPDLHILLKSAYFSKWPLEVCFFSVEAYQAWQGYCERVDIQLSLSIKVSFRAGESAGKNELESSRASEKTSGSNRLADSGIQSIDPTYKPLAKFVEKGRFLLGEDEDFRCAICHKAMNTTRDLIVLCSQSYCRSVSHLRCLSSKFLAGARNPDLVFPSAGSCPSCKSTLQWAELMKELTLRTRGQRMVDELLKRIGKVKQGKSRGDADLDDGIVTEECDLTAVDLARVDGDLHDTEDDMVSVTSLDSESPVPLRSGRQKEALPIVIEDSELDG